MDEWLKTIEDPQIRDILIMQYRNGRTQEQIADELGYTRGGIAAKLKRFWDSQSETQKTKQMLYNDITERQVRSYMHFL